MTKANYSDKRDKNEPEIVAEFERLGYHVIRMGRTAGFDLLVIGNGKSHIVEVKNPESCKFTKAELILQQACISRGVDYNVVLYPFQVESIN